jgi:CspA family cold shock protein
VNGQMIWFNPEKGFGYIRTEEDERLFVETAGFAEGNDPESRGGGKDVAFERIVSNTGPLAVSVRYVTVPEQRRARLRHAR